MINVKVLEAKIKAKTVMLINREECKKVANRKNTTISNLIKGFREYAAKSKRYGDYYEVNGLINLTAFIDYMRYEDEFRNDNRNIPPYNPKQIEEDLIRDTPIVDMSEVVNEMIHSPEFISKIKEELSNDMFNKFREALAGG